MSCNYDGIVKSCDTQRLLGFRCPGIMLLGIRYIQCIVGGCNAAQNADGIIKLVASTYKNPQLQRVSDNGWFYLIVWSSLL